MATYVNDLRLTELATGEGSGTWGVTTNTNLELIGEALGYGTQDCFASDADATTTVADGASDPARAMYFKVTSSASLTATRTLTIAPNTMTRVMLIENATTGSQSIAISQGSGGNVTIANGAVKMVYLDGAGATAAVVDAMASLELGTITVANLTATTADINGGTIDGATIGGASAAAGTFTTLNATGGGALTGTWSDLGTVTTVDINGGTIDGATIGGASAGAGTFTNLTASGTVSFSGATVSNGGSVTTIDINGGTIDGTVIGGATPAAGSFTTVGTSSNVTVGGTLDVSGLSSFSALEATGNVTTTSSGGLRLKIGKIAGVPSDATDAFVAIQDSGGPGTLAGDLILIPRSSNTVNSAVRFYSGYTTPAERFAVAYGEAAFNDPGNDYDFRVESDVSTHMLFVDAGNSRVGIGETVPGSLLTLNDPVNAGGAAKNTIAFSNAGWGNPTAANQPLDGGVKLALFSGSTQKVQIGMNPGAAMWFNATGSGTTGFKFYSANTDAATPVERFSIGQTGDSTFNPTGVDADLRIASAGNSHMLFVDASTSRVHIGGSSVGDGELNVNDMIRISGAAPELRIDVGSNGYYLQLTEEYNFPKSIGHIRSVASTSYDGQLQFSANQGGGAFRELARMDYVDGTVFNETSVDLDFRVESNNNTHALFVDAGNDRVGFFDTSAPLSTVEMVTGNGTVGDSGNFLSIKSGAGNLVDKLQLGVNSTSGYGFIQAIKPGTGTEPLLIQPNGGSVIINENGEANNDFRVESDTNTHMLFVDASAEAVIIGNNAKRTTGGFDPALTIDDNKNSAFFRNNSGGAIQGMQSGGTTGAQNFLVFYNQAGTSIGSVQTSNGNAGTTVSYNTSSDARLKENIADAEDASSLVDAIQVRQFDWKADGSHQRYGMVAQELIEVAPEAVSQPEDPEEMMGVDYSKLVPMLIKEIQSLRARVHALEGK